MTVVSTCFGWHRKESDSLENPFHFILLLFRFQVPCFLVSNETSLFLFPVESTSGIFFKTWMDDEGG